MNIFFMQEADCEPFTVREAILHENKFSAKEGRLKGACEEQATGTPLRASNQEADFVYLFAYFLLTSYNA
jgi:hypothetical protein